MAQDKSFSIICPLYKDNYQTLDKFLLCLSEQDYKNYELILVYNSPNEDAKGLIHSKNSPLKKYKGKWKDLDAGYDPKLKNGNHCKAFNVGAMDAKGDYLLFLDPDIYLYPGTLREYKDAFEKHPEVDFVYGDYDFEGGVGRIQGRPYRKYELQCANYISGAFPIKKEAFRWWDPQIQSLQDWDMWLSAVEGGAQGLYIERPFFSTDAPTSEGISATGAGNWIETYKTVREKHKHPISETVVTSLGAPFHATNSAEALGVDTRVLTNIHTFKPHTYQNIILLGFYPKGWESHMALFYEGGDFTKPLFGKNRIIHWIGTDIYQMQHSLSWMAWKNVVGFLNSPDFNFKHLAECAATREELRDLGIEADVVPLPPVNLYDFSPLPEKFTVGIYINPTQDMYFESVMYEIADALPDIDFKFFGNPNLKKVEDNKEWVGFVDMKEFLPTISALVRITRHDGLPISPLEAMQAGRNVLASHPLEHAIHVPLKDGQPDKEKIIEGIREMEGKPLNKEGSTYWRHELSPELYRERMAKYLA